MKLVFIGLIGVLLILVTLYYMRTNEGFASGSILTVGSQPTVGIPSPSQESNIPNGQPGAVVNNPNTSLASTQDIIAAQDAMKLFNESANKLNQTDALYNIIDNPNTPDDKKYLIGFFLGMVDSLLGSYNIALSSTDLKLTLADVTNIRSAVEGLTSYMLTTSNTSPYIAPEPKVSENELKSVENRVSRYVSAIKKNKNMVIQTIQSAESLEIPKEVLTGFVGVLPVYLKGLTMSVEKKRPITLTKKDYEENTKLLNLLDKFVKIEKSGVSTVVPDDKDMISKTTKPTGVGATPTSLSSTQRPSLRQRGRGVPASPLAGRTALYEIAGPYLNKNDLQELINRIQAYRKKLVDLRSNAASIRARVDQLEKLGADVSAIRVQLVRGTMKPEEIPIETESARMFLKNIESDPIPPLIAPKGESTKTAIDFAHAKGAAGVAAGTFGVPMDANVQRLMESAKDLKWSIEATVMYDPAVAQRDKLIDRLASVEKQLQKITVKGSEVPKEVVAKIQAELAALTSALAKSSIGPYGGISGDVRPEIPTSTRIPSSSLGSNVYNPSKDDVKKACDGGSVGGSEISPDVYSRPGMLMSDEAIKRRASGSQPIAADSTGGLDYKQRSIDLCNQIKGSGLGDPKDFGCVPDPSQVGAGYSWKGNYKMVCSRLGNTWGGFYPEMMGCGKYDSVKAFDGASL